MHEMQPHFSFLRFNAAELSWVAARDNSAAQHVTCMILYSVVTKIAAVYAECVANCGLTPRAIWARTILYISSPLEGVLPGASFLSLDVYCHIG